MIYRKRIVVTTALGIVFGLAGMNVESFLISGVFTTAMMTELLLNRALIGFFIGMSGWKRTHWVYNGAVIGFLLSMCIAVTQDFVVRSTLVVLGTIYGALIEYVTVRYFKAPITS